MLKSKAARFLHRHQRRGKSLRTPSNKRPFHVRRKTDQKKMKTIVEKEENAGLTRVFRWKTFWKNNFKQEIEGVTLLILFLPLLFYSS